MTKLLLSGGMLLLALTVSTPALAQIVVEPFDPTNTLPDTDPLYPNGYIVGGPLSAYRWTGGGDTTGALDIENVGGAHGNVVKLSVNYTTDPMPLVIAQANDWAGPARASHQLWLSADFERGIGDSEFGNNVWQVVFQNANGETLVQMQGGLGVARLRSVGTATITPLAALDNFNFVVGWNQFAILSDTSIPYDPLYDPVLGVGVPNLWVYLNGVETKSYSVDVNGPLGVEDDPTNSPGIVRIIRNARDPEPPTVNEATMRIDNILTAPGRPGDANHDRFIDIFDINLVSANWGSPGGPAGDTNFDGNVDIFDINLISANWAPAPPPGGSAAVPEPATWALLSVGLAGILAVGRTRIRR